MDAAGLAVRAAVLFAAAAAVALVVLPSLSPAASAASPVQGVNGDPMPVPTEAGVRPGTFHGIPVNVFLVNRSILDGVEAQRGKGESTPCLPRPGGLCLFALSAKSTFLGCTVAFNADIGASRDVPDYDGDGDPDGRAIDRCHQGQWDVYRRAMPVPGTPAPVRLAALDLSVRDGALWATAFDGPTAAVGCSKGC
jgi:Rieske Fe-S protein